MGIAFSQTIILMNEIHKNELARNKNKNKNKNNIKYSRVNTDDTSITINNINNINNNVNNNVNN